jgi:ethanolamine ammonia-lyase large subunit
MGIPGSDDVMLNYQTTSFHDALYVRRVLGLKPAPEFEAWLEDEASLYAPSPTLAPPKLAAWLDDNAETVLDVLFTVQR